ncbi:hypothetical protein GJ688_12870 [Heliobacillus mobilis]|uniref:Uncharacterized protein n=1 Tax=Heliobacterium mobile TaxID=28064 RepID=A0A6I3SMA3_HELMO|nr:hypothetical protein [Heliobacterium mobile]MTV49865.1 hypothetical protein [Heliobacterium mobile]
MIQVLNKIGLVPTVLNIEEKDIIIASINKDRVFIILSINKPEELREISYYIPGLKKVILEKVNSKNNLELADERLIPISKILWDIYIIGVHKITSESASFNQSDISEIQRDRFVARKIIIQYNDNDELEKLLYNVICPEKKLNELIGSIDPPLEINIQDILESSYDYKKIFNKDVSEITIEDLSSFVDILSKDLNKN